MSKKTISGEKAKLSTEPYKGVRDFYPEDQAFLNWFMYVCREVAGRFGYVEYHASILEPAELYKAKGGENEEIVNDQSYTFLDRGGREVTLRPEMTPTVARMVAARRRELGFPLRFFSIPNVFRYERPQRGRLREHWQLNVDLFGSHSPAADAEIIIVAHDIMKAFGVEGKDFEIRMNNRKIMEDVLLKMIGVDSERAQKVIRLLDGYEKDMEGTSTKIQELIGEEKLHTLKGFLKKPDLDVLREQSEAFDDFQKTRAQLKSLGIETSYQMSLVRGFDYYTGMVFEVYDTHPDNNRSLFGGGRYDNLTTLFDDEAVTGVGFGMGDVTMHDFLDVRGRIQPYISPTKVYLAVASQEMVATATELAGELRRQGVNTAVDFGDRKLADQIKTASKQKVPYLIVVGQNEKDSGLFTVRNLVSGEERELPRENVGAFFLS